MVIIVAVVGLVIGSFANVCILRSHQDESLLVPSHCPSCNHPIAWYDLIPVISFCFLRGRCRYCKNSISPLYPMVEILLGGMYGLLFWQFGLSTVTFYFCGVVFFLAIIGIGDLLYTEIDDRHIIGSLIWIFGWKIYFGIWTIALTGAIIGMLAGTLIFAFGRWFYGEVVFGSGDVFLSAVMGALGGYDRFLPIYILAWSLMLLLALGLKLFHLPKHRPIFVPFAPVLILSWLMMFQ